MIKWIKSIAVTVFILLLLTMMTKAVAQSKTEMIYISSKSCVYCIKLEKEVFNDTEVKIAMKDIVIKKADINDRVARDYNVRAVPYVVFLQNEKVVKVFVGYVSKQQFLQILKEIQKENINE